MSATTAAAADGGRKAPPTGAFAFLARCEDLVLVLAVAAIVLIPLAEIVLRGTLATGISGSSSIVQHLTLVLGMVGGAVAAREGRMLSLSTGEAFFKGRVRDLLRLFSHAFASAIAAYLFVASFEFVASEREAGAELAYGIPLWIVQAVLPLGFGLVSARLFLDAARGWRGRVLVAAIVALALLLGIQQSIAPEDLVWPGLVLLVLATLAGAPVFVTLGGAALILSWGAGLPIASIPVDHYRLVTNPTLPSIPLFTLAGYFLAEGGASKRLIRVCQALFGALRGGPAIVTVAVCAFFTTFTGASGVTILALGGLLMPLLLSARFPERSALGLLTGAGSLGLLFPPCLPLILYAIVARTTMEEMFLGGILPGVLLVVLTIAWGVRQSRSADAPPLQPFDAREAARAVWEAKWELLLPVVAFVTLFGGFATPVEAAAATALYAFTIETWIYRDLDLARGVPRVMVECGLLIGGVLLILGVALGFTNYLIFADFPTIALDWVTATVESPLVFLLFLNLFLLVVGCLMDIFSAIIVVVPLIVPMGAAFGIDPVHLGIIFLANLELGYLTPPVGMNLFLASYRLNKPMSEVYRAAMPMLFVLGFGVLVITYVPALTTLLPRWWGS